MRTAKQIVDDCNSLARRFYSMGGCDVSDDFKFYDATHPEEAGCWNQAVAAYEHIEGTEVEDALNEYLED
jgi:hypothetical protein